MPSVFHYTDARGLLGILSSESLFATDYRYLNDLTEGTVIRNLLMPIFEAEVAQITPKLVQRGWLKKGFYDQHGVSGHRLQAEKVYSSLARPIDNIAPFFVLSFCRHEHGSEAFGHGLLSQWRGYADRGGFAIEFDEQELDQLMKSEVEEYAYAGMKSDDVRYGKFDELFDPKIYAGVAGEMTRSLFDDQHIDVTEVTGRKDIDEVLPAFINTAPFLKHWGFSEYRIVAACTRGKKIPEGEQRPAKPIQFRTRNDLIIPYIELFGTAPKLPIKSIIVGPHPSQEKQEQAVRLLLESECVDAVVRCSEIPYRK